MIDSQTVVIERGALAVIQSAAAKSGFRHEVGGVLLGCYRGPHLHIGLATQPQASDRANFSRFWRATLGHQDIAEEAWRRSRKTMTYAGEWHTHPEAYPTPSLIDRADWTRKLAEQQRDLLFLIQAREGFYMEFAPRVGPHRSLDLIEEDEEALLWRINPRR
jgi:integrative and conjugative element protein (TIGR02256 family)